MSGENKGEGQRNTSQGDQKPNRTSNMKQTEQATQKRSWQSRVCERKPGESKEAERSAIQASARCNSSSFLTHLGDLSHSPSFPRPKFTINRLSSSLKSWCRPLSVPDTAHPTCGTILATLTGVRLWPIFVAASLRNLVAQNAVLVADTAYRARRQVRGC